MFALIIWIDPDTPEKVIAPFLTEQEAEEYYCKYEYGLRSIIPLEPRK